MRKGLVTLDLAGQAILADKGTRSMTGQMSQIKLRDTRLLTNMFKGLIDICRNVGGGGHTICGAPGMLCVVWVCVRFGGGGGRRHKGPTTMAASMNLNKVKVIKKGIRCKGGAKTRGSARQGWVEQLRLLQFTYISSLQHPQILSCTPTNCNTVKMFFVGPRIAKLPGTMCLHPTCPGSGITYLHCGCKVQMQQAPHVLGGQMHALHVPISDELEPA